MSEAILVNDASKKFDNPQGQLLTKWSRLAARSSRRSQPSVLDAEQPPFVLALDHVSFAVQPGEIFGLLGLKGAGKSTLIRLLATLLTPDSGYLRIFGYDVVRQPAQVQRLINPVSVEASFFKKLSPLENLLPGVSWHTSSSNRRQAVATLTQLGLKSSALFHPMEEMSRGDQQKVSIARSLLAQPRLLLLDEPTAGLDWHSKQAIWQTLRNLRDQQRVTILLATRSAEEAAALCDRVAVLTGGLIASIDSSAGLRQRLSEWSLSTWDMAFQIPEISSSARE